MADKITISKTEYYNLKCSQAKLEMLECGGVDNWEWYGESLFPDDDCHPDFNAVKEEIHDEIFG